LLTSGDYSALIIAYKNNAPVKLTDVRHHPRRRRKRAAGRMDESDARGHSEYSTAARREYYFGG